MQKKHFKTLLWGILFLVSMAMPQKASAYWTSCIRNESYSTDKSGDVWLQEKSFWVGVFNYDGSKNAYFSGEVWVTLDGTNAVKLNDLWSMVSSSGDETNYKKNGSNKNLIDRETTVTVNGVKIFVRCESYYNNWDIDKNQGGGKWTMLDMYVRVYDLRKHTVALSGNFRDADANTNYQISNKASWTIGFPHVTSVTVTQTNNWDVNVSWTASEQPTEGSWLVFPCGSVATSTTIDVNSMSAEIPYSKHKTQCGNYNDFYVTYVPKGFKVPSNSDVIIKLNLYSKKNVFIQHVPGDKYNVKKAATCTEDGTAKHICKYDKDECGEEFSLPALGHNFTSEDKGDVYLKAKATCSKDAEYYHKCSRCAEKGTSTWSLTNSKIAHVYTNYTYNNDATCTKAGTKTASCNYGCGNTDSKADETHPVTAHVYTNYTYNNDATCTKAGTKTASCNYGCGNTDSKADETHPMIDHVYTNYTYNNDATCTKAGTKTASCNYGCGNTDSKADETHPVTAHVYTNYTYNNDATCTKAGTKTASCNYGCGNTDSKADETHPMTAHDLNREIYNSNGMYVTKCKDCHDVDSYDYSRDIKANWNTICLPFAAQSTAGTKFYTIQSLTDGVITLEPAETLAAGKPALVYTTSNATLAISSSDNTFVTDPVNASGTNCLVGTFTDITVPVDDNNYYFGLSANKGTYVQVKSAGVALGAYRAYIKCSKTDGAAGLRQVIADEDINETAISDVVDTLNDSEAQYFDMNGRKMNGLQKGINIIKINGKVTKVYVK